MSDIITIERPGFRLAASVSGPNTDAPWLVLSNSLGASMVTWEPQRALLARRYRVLSYDTRGHGNSDTPPGPYRLDDLVGDAAAILDHFEIRTATFMGLSLGGMTGLGLAIHHPERIERLVCCSARADASPAYVQGWNDRLAAIDAGGLAAILPGTMERWFVDEWRAAHPAELERIKAAFLATSVEGYRGCVAALKQLDYLKDLPRIPRPVLYVAGQKDVAAPPAVMQAMADATPGSRYVEVPDGAHLCNIDQADAFNRAVAPFLDLA